MEAKEVIEEMKIATGWNNISLVNGTIVLKLDINEMKMITGLKRSSDSLYLDFDDFMEYPISFLVTSGNIAFQYWTLRKQLHRTNDLPAYVSYDPDSDRIIRRWYWNGLKHRTTGPAQEMTTGFKVTELAGFPNFYQETWDTMNLQWFQEGFASRYPYCSEATMDDGSRIKNKTTNKVQSPRSDLPTLVVENCKLTWDHFVPSQEFRPSSVVIIELRESYNEGGEMTLRECTQCDFEWRRADDVFPAADHTAFNEAFKDDLLSMVDLWGPFYKDGATEFVLISEFERLRGTP